MYFNIGDKVIHWTHGLGEVVHIEEKTILSEPKKCYVVRTPELMIWIPVDDLQQCSLRLPTPPNEFVNLIAILTSPCQTLSEDRVERKNQLMAQMRDGQLASVCRVIRDLMHYGRAAKLNDHERSILDRAMNSLLTEWTYSLNMPLNQAQTAISNLLSI